MRAKYDKCTLIYFTASEGYIKNQTDIVISQYPFDFLY